VVAIMDVVHKNAQSTLGPWTIGDAFVRRSI